MKTHEVLAVCIGLGMLIIMFIVPALMSAWDNWKERHDHK